MRQNREMISWMKRAGAAVLAGMLCVTAGSTADTDPIESVKTALTALENDSNASAAGSAVVRAYAETNVETDAGAVCTSDGTQADDSTDAYQLTAGTSAAQISKETLQPGASYSNYQWAYKNNGNMRETVPFQTSGLILGAGGMPYQPRAIVYPIRGFKQIDAQAGIDINMDAAWQYYLQNSGRRQVTVALIDTGVDTSHSELSGSIWVNEDEIPGDGIDNDGNGYVDDVNGWNFYDNNNQVQAADGEEHATHGAGTIAAAWDGTGISGIADGNWVKIMVLKVMGGKDGVGVAENVKKAIRYAEENGADICNLSLGTNVYDAEMDELIRNSSMLFVAAAGNGDSRGNGYSIDRNPIYPAAYTADNLISVANLNFDGNLEASSNYGTTGVDLAAPGTYILSTVPGGYDFMSGTSMAAPMVTGVAALVYSCRTDMSLLDVKQAILASSRKLDTLNGLVATGGMLDAYGAISYQRP